MFREPSEVGVEDAVSVHPHHSVPNLSTETTLINNHLCSSPPCSPQPVNRDTSD